MATKQVGLSARVQFEGDAAVAGMKKTSGAFNTLTKSAQMARAGMANVKNGLAGMATTGLWAGAGVGFTVKKFADFDGQMGAVKAVLGSAAAKDFPALTEEAKRLGATTSFTATQAAEAMENLARSGQSPKQIMASIGPVLAAAAAEGMDLGTAADIVASNLKAFGLEASEATRVADTLAFVSAKTNTNMSGLQEGLKFVGPIARGMQIPVEDTAAALGVLADVGLKGSLAGTGLKNALLKIAKGAKDGKLKVGKFTTEVKKSADGGVDLAGTMLGITERLSAITDPLERTNAGMKLLGLRGQGAASAFAALDKDKAKLLFEGMQEAARGSAAEMQRMRLDNLKGDFTLLSSAIDGVVNSIGGALAGSVRGAIGKGGIGGLTGKLSEVSKAAQYFGQNWEAVLSGADVKIDGVSQGVTEFVRGVLQGVNDVKRVFAGVTDTIGNVMSAFGGTKAEGTKTFARLATGAIGLSIAMAPIGLAIKGTTKLFGPFARIGVGALKTVAGATRPLLAGLSKATGGLMDKIGLGKNLPGIAGKLAKAANVVDKATASPVRVVNFDEAGGALGTGLGGTGAGATTAAAGTGGVRAGLEGFVSRFGVVGRALNSSWSSMGKAGMGLTKRLGIMGAAAAAAGAAGYAFGSWLDSKFGISDKLATGLHKLFNASQIAASKHRVEVHAQDVAMRTAGDHARRLAQLSEAGLKDVEVRGAGGKKTRAALTRELAVKQITSMMKRDQLPAQQIADMLEGLESTLSKLPTAKDLKIAVNIDGKKVGQAVGGTTVEGRERGQRKGGRAAAARGVQPSK